MDLYWINIVTVMNLQWLIRGTGMDLLWHTFLIEFLSRKVTT